MNANTTMPPLDAYELLSMEEFDEILQFIPQCFTDPVLQGCTVDRVGSGMFMLGGAYGHVTKMTTPSGRRFGVKTFHNDNGCPNYFYDLRRTLDRLAELKLASAVRAEFRRNEIRFRGKLYPCVVMDWHDQHLAAFVDDQLLSLTTPTGDPSLHLGLVLAGLGRTPLEKVLHSFVLSIRELNVQGIAVPDCHFKNIPVVHGYRVQHWDSDGWFIPGVHRESIGEQGMDGLRHPRRLDCYESPYRTALKGFHFTAWVMFLVLVLAVVDPDLFRKLHQPGTDALIGLEPRDFVESDHGLGDPSRVFAQLLHSSVPVITLMQQVCEFADGPLEEVPPLLVENLDWLELPHIPSVLAAPVFRSPKNLPTTQSPTMKFMMRTGGPVFRSVANLFARAS